MRQRLLVVFYFSIAGFSVFILTILGALSAMDGGSEPWNTEVWVLFLTPTLLAILFTLLGIRQHKHYVRNKFKNITPSKRDASIFRILNVLVVTIAGFFILLGLALLTEVGKLLAALGSLLLGVLLIFASIKIHKNVR